MQEWPLLHGKNSSDNLCSAGHSPLWCLLTCLEISKLPPCSTLCLHLSHLAPALATAYFRVCNQRILKEKLLYNEFLWESDSNTKSYLQEMYWGMLLVATPVKKWETHPMSWGALQLLCLESLPELMPVHEVVVPSQHWVIGLHPRRQVDVGWLTLLKGGYEQQPQNPLDLASESGYDINHFKKIHILK